MSDDIKLLLDLGVNIYLLITVIGISAALAFGTVGAVVVTIYHGLHLLIDKLTEVK